VIGGAGPSDNPAPIYPLGPHPFIALVALERSIPSVYYLSSDEITAGRRMNSGTEASRVRPMGFFAYG
jgi:hypothetical protein